MKWICPLLAVQFLASTLLASEAVLQDTLQGSGAPDKELNQNARDRQSGTLVEQSGPVSWRQRPYGTLQTNEFLVGPRGLCTALDGQPTRKGRIVCQIEENLSPSLEGKKYAISFDCSVAFVTVDGNSPASGLNATDLRVLLDSEQLSDINLDPSANKLMIRLTPVNSSGDRQAIRISVHVGEVQIPNYDVAVTPESTATGLRTKELPVEIIVDEVGKVCSVEIDGQSVATNVNFGEALLPGGRHLGFGASREVREADFQGNAIVHVLKNLKVKLLD